MLKFKMLKMDFFFSMDSFSSEIQYFLVAFLRKLTPFLSIFLSFVLLFFSFSSGLRQEQMKKTSASLLTTVHGCLNILLPKITAGEPDR